MKTQMVQKGNLALLCSDVLAFVSKIGGSKHASSSRLLSQAQVRGRKGDAVLPDPGTCNKVLSLDLLK